MGNAAKKRVPEPGPADSLFNLVRHLDDDELWKFVCLMNPDLDQEQLEDVYDILSIRFQDGEGTVTFREVFGRTPEKALAG